MTTASKRAKGRKAGPAKATRLFVDSNKKSSGPIPVGARVRIVGEVGELARGVWVVRREMLCGQTRYLVLAQDGYYGFPCVPEQRCELVAETAMPEPEPVAVTRAAPVGLWEQTA